MSTKVRILCLLLCLSLLLAASASAVLCYQIRAEGTYDYSKAYAVLDELNAYRAENGLGELTMDADLLEAAMQRAAEISIHFDHTRPDGSKCYTASPKMMGENIANGYNTVALVMNAWKNSPGHNANMLDKSWRSVGIGCAYLNGKWNWVQCFGTTAGTPETVPSSGAQTKSYVITAAKEGSSGGVSWTFDGESGTLTITGSGTVSPGLMRNWAVFATTVVVGEGITAIDAKAFEDFRAMQQVSLPSTLQSVGAYAFSGCYNLTEVSYNGLSEDWAAVSVGSGNSRLTSAALQTTDPVHEHDWGEGVETQALTCTQDGIITYTCACGETRTETTPAPGHNFDHGICTRCGEPDPDYVPAPGDHTPGDINGDGKVNNKDLTRLAQYLAGKSVTVVSGALDVNGDGKVNNKDLTRLAQYLAGKSVVLY